MLGSRGADGDPLASKLLQVLCFGSKSELKALFAAGEVDVEGDRTKGLKPLLAAAGHGNADHVKLLIAKGAKVNAPSRYNVPISNRSTLMLAEVGERALHCSAKAGQLQATRALLRAGADPTCVDANGRTPISLAAIGPNTEGQFLEVARALIEAGADVTAADNAGWTPLHQAANRGSVDMMGLLLSEAPRTVNSFTKTGETPLYFAAREGSGEAVSRLLAAGAGNSSELAARGFCPLAVAVQNGNEDVVRVLVEEGLEAIGGGADVILFALILATVRGQVKILLLLLGAEGEVRRAFWARCMFDGMRILHYAAGFGCLSATRVLLAAGAVESDTDSSGRTPRDVIGDMNRSRVPTLPASHPCANTGVRRLERDQAREEKFIGRALDRGPAFRARSWAWRAEKGFAAGGRGSATAVALSQGPPAKRHLRTRIRIARPRDDKFFVNLLGRYAQKN